MSNESEEMVRVLRRWSEAYPEDIFPPVTQEDRDNHPGVVTRAAAQMGRHMAKFMSEAADCIEKLE